MQGGACIGPVETGGYGGGRGGPSQRGRQYRNVSGCPVVWLPDRAQECFRLPDKPGQVSGDYARGNGKSAVYVAVGRIMRVR